MLPLPPRYRIAGNHYAGRECVILERVSGSYYMVALTSEDGEFHHRTDVVTMSADCLTLIERA